MHLAPGLAVNLCTGERRHVAELSNIVAMAGITILHVSLLRSKRVGRRYRNAFRWSIISLSPLTM